VYSEIKTSLDFDFGPLFDFIIKVTLSGFMGYSKYANNKMFSFYVSFIYTILKKVFIIFLDFIYKNKYGAFWNQKQFLHIGHLKT